MLDGAFDQELAREMLGRDGLGVAKEIVRQAALAEARRAHGATAPTSAVAAVHGPEATAGGAAALDTVDAGAWVAPVPGRVTSAFGVRRDPIAGDERLHEGIDIAAASGTPVRAVADGEVTFSGARGASGNVVEIRHADGMVTSYAHAARTLVSPGQKVEAGDTIATVGSTGRATGPHLHFVLRRDGEPRDPAALLRAPVPPAAAGDEPEV
jgi:murein DD-endopeptidase MepM/ murein hydrolase activator NlpD